MCRNIYLLKNMGILPMKLAMPTINKMGWIRAPSVDRPPINCRPSTSVACLFVLESPSGLQQTSCNTRTDTRTHTHICHGFILAGGGSGKFKQGLMIVGLERVKRK